MWRCGRVWLVDITCVNDQALQVVLNFKDIFPGWVELFARFELSERLPYTNVNIQARSPRFAPSRLIKS